MSGVKRYDCTNGKAQHCYGCYQMTECELGDYVSSEDYDRDTQELERIEQQLCETEARALKWYHQINAHVDLYRELRAERDTLHAANQRLESDLASARTTAEHWKAEHLAGNAVIERLEGALRTLHGLMHHKATTPLELEAIRMSEAALRGNGGDV